MSNDAAKTPKRRMLRGERRAHLVRAAARAFLERGFAATSLEDVAAAAEVTKVIIYRHFESKFDLYLSVLRDTRERIGDRTGDPELYAEHSIADFAMAAREVPDGFRLLYRHASREPEFADVVNEINSVHFNAAEKRLREQVPEPARRRWISSLTSAMIVEAVLTWLDADEPVEPAELGKIVAAGLQAMTTAPSLNT